MEKNQNANDIVVEQTTTRTEESAAETPKGILYETSLKQAEKNAKKEKRKGVLQFIKYALCAASAGIIQIVLFSILQAVIPSNGKTIHFIVEDMDLVTFIATTVALCASILWNFTFNRKFTFKDAGNVPKAMILAFLFYVPFYPFQTWYVHTIKSLLVEAIGTDGAGIIAEGSVMLINFALEFMWQKFVVFRKPKDKKGNKTEENENSDEPENTEIADNTNNNENSENTAE